MVHHEFERVHPELVEDARTATKKILDAVPRCPLVVEERAAFCELAQDPQLFSLVLQMYAAAVPPQRKGVLTVVRDHVLQREPRVGRVVRDLSHVSIFVHSKILLQPHPQGSWIFDAVYQALDVSQQHQLEDSALQLFVAQYRVRSYVTAVKVTFQFENRHELEICFVTQKERWLEVLKLVPQLEKNKAEVFELPTRAARTEASSYIRQKLTASKEQRTLWSTA